MENLESRLGYVFKEKALLEEALTHTSFLQENPQARHNQRLEFLGDAVLNLALAQALFRANPHAREGFLTDCRSTLAGAETLADIGAELRLQDEVRLPKAQDNARARARPRLRVEAMEAILGAVYLDAGFLRAQDLILKIYGDFEARLARRRRTYNAKGRLQEWCAKNAAGQAPVYNLKREGPEHAAHFKVELNVLGITGAGEGGTKKEAEENAAAQVLDGLRAAFPQGAKKA